MNSELEKFVDRLRGLDPKSDEDISGILYELIEPIEQLTGAEEIVPEIFSFMERFPAADIGSPGALVHFVERFYPAYVEQLIASVGRQPTPHTIWMVNRVLNAGQSLELEERLLLLLRSMKDHPKASVEVRENAVMFLAHQAECGRSNL